MTVRIPVSNPEPFRIEWSGGMSSAGYLGRDRWRCVSTTSDACQVDGSKQAARVLIAGAFHGALEGAIVASRAPMTIHVGGGESFLATGDARRIDGWTLESAAVRFDVGGRAALEEWIGDSLAARARLLWASGVAPTPRVAIGPTFSFDAFSTDSNPEERCHALEFVLAERLAEDPWPPTELHDAAMELRAIGHDLWSWDYGRSWGHDYMTKRAGAGLMLSLSGRDGYEDDDLADDDSAEGVGVPRIRVTFAKHG